MNIFYLDHDPRTCAMYHNNKHCVKMIVEVAQILSTAHRVLDGHKVVVTAPRKKTTWELPSNPDLYKATHINHPSAVWARESNVNYIWLRTLLFELLGEYTHRYGKVHKVQHSKLIEKLWNPPSNIPKTIIFTPPPLAMDDECKIGNALESYREYYRVKKSHLASWKNRPIPSWYQ